MIWIAKQALQQLQEEAMRLVQDLPLPSLLDLHHMWERLPPLMALIGKLLRCMHDSPPCASQLR